MTKQKRRAQPIRRRRVPSFARPLIALVALVVAAYANAFRNGFVLDDIPMIVENPLVRDTGNIGEIFTTNYWSRGRSVALGDSTLYRPLTVFTYAVDHSLWDSNPLGFHLTNVALHATATVVLFLIAVTVLGSTSAAFAAAAIFAVHPVHTEAVTGVVGRAELLAALFFLAAFRTLRSGQSLGTGTTIARATGGAVLYLLALFSKEIAVTLPAVLALDDWLHRDELPRERRSMVATLALRYGALALALGIYLGFRAHAVGGGSQIWPGFAGVSTWHRVLTASRVLLEYIGLFIFPRTLSADYWKTDVAIARSMAEPLVLVSVLLWIALAALVIRQRRRDAALALSIAWFFITIAPVSNVLLPIGVAKAERLVYLPSVGLCLLAGLAYGRAEAHVRNPRWTPRLALALVLVALSARTFVRNGDWRDNLTLAQATLAVSPSSPLLNDVAAGELVKRGDAKRATELLREAVRQAPDMPLIRGHLGAAYHAQGLLDQASAEYREAIRRNPRDAEAHNNLGVVYLSRGHAAEAVAEFSAAVRIDPSYADAHMNLGVAFLDASRWEDAVAEFTVAVQANPESAKARNALGVAYFRQGQLERAVEQYREALRLDPGFAAARENLARVDAARAGQSR